MTVSIIIPVWNQQAMTEECIDAIRRFSPDNVEIVVVDNGSTPPFFFGGMFHDDILIRNEDNLGFPRAVNQGIRAATGEVIVLMNNDVVVTPGWLSGILDVLGRGYSIVGPATNYCAGVQRETIHPAYRDLDELAASAGAWVKKTGGEIIPVRFVIGFLMAFRRALFDELGEFDESLWPCSGEEIDFCFRAIDRGHKIGYCRSVYVHHYGSRTFEDMQDAGLVDYKAICERNDAHLAERWGSDFWHNQVVDTQYEPVGLCINLGCGSRKLRGYINVDQRKSVDPDICLDIMRGLPYEDNSVDRILANDFMEHIPTGKVIGVVTEIWRVLKPGGIFESSTPSTDGRGAFQDPTHVSFWNRNSWAYYTVDEYRELCGIEAKFDIVSIQDVETSRAHRIIHTHVVAKAVKP